MWKKVTIAVVAVAAGLLVLGMTNVGRKACSLAKLSWQRAEDGMEKAIPPEVEIARLRNELKSIDKLKDKHIDQMVEEKVAVDQLRDKIKVQSAKLDKQKEVLVSIDKKLQGDDQHISFGDQKYPRAKVEKDLARDYESYKIARESVKSQEQLLAQREEALKAARDHLASFDDVKKDLELQLAKLEADLNTIRAQEHRSKFVVNDGGKLDQIKTDVEKLRTRLEIKSAKLKAKAEFTDSDSVQKAKEEVKTRDALKEMRDEFKNGEKAVAEQK